MSNIEQDLNTTIAAAVNARVEAQVFAALSGDEVIGRFISAALNEIQPQRDRYSTREKPQTFMARTLEVAIQKATKAAVERFIEEEVASIEDEVRKALRRDLKRIAETLTGSLVEAAHKAYGVKVDMSVVIPKYES